MRRVQTGLTGLLLLASCATALAAEKSPDLRRAVPADVYLAVYGKHNPHRDFQREYYKAVWRTVEDTKVVERVTQMVAARLSHDQNEQAKAILGEIQAAAAPIKLQALADAQEVVYAQKMAAASKATPTPVAQHLWLLRLTPEAAEQTQAGMKNLFGLVEKYTKGMISVKSTSENEATIVTLELPSQVPYQPTVVRFGDVFLFSSSGEFARQSLDMLAHGTGTSKFDDPRLKEALQHLPAPEDALVFYDSKAQMNQMRKLPTFVRSTSHGDKKAEQVAGLMEMVFEEAAVLDFQVTVEYTEGNLNRKAEYAKFLPGIENKTFEKVFDSGKPFEKWDTWVPADALSFSLSTGANLHPLYERILAVVKERFPEAQGVLDKLEAVQTMVDFHLDRDLLQAFSGEYVSVSLPVELPTPFGSSESVVALRCQKPDRIGALLHRLTDLLKQHPAAAAQQLRLTKCEELPGFEELSVQFLAGLGVKPVIGFHEGWMMVGSSADAVKKVLDTRAGNTPSIAGTKSFEQFHLKVEGPVRSIRYGNTAQSLRRAAALLNQVGTMAPMFLSMAAGNAKPEELKPIQDALGLLPSVAKIVAKFDFFQASMSVVQAGDQPGTCLKRSVIVVRPPAQSAQ